MARGGEESDTGEFVPLGTGAVQQVINAVQMLTSQVEGIGARDSAPRRVVRDPQTGDIIGVEVEGGSAKRVVRDPMTGDIVGVETIQ
jgi:hypothetical protein